MMPAVRNNTGTLPLPAGRKKPRKPYTISRPREKWTVDEHERFLRSLLMFGRDWKTIEQFVVTKTATQIRSHAQKYFLKAHKLGLAAPPLPPAHPRRAAVIPTNTDMDHRAPFTGTSNRCGKAPGFNASLPSEDEDGRIQLPLSSDDLRFAEVYRFVGDVFGSGAPRPVEAQLQRLHGMDPVVAETILLVLKNFEDNLCAY